MIVTKLSQLPDLRAAKRLAFDLETHDPQLRELGPGVRRGATVVGAAVATEGGEGWYLPLGHEGGPNLGSEGARRWLRDTLGVPGRLVLGANLMYDLDFAAEAGWPAAGPFRDVLHAGRLLDLQGKYPSLDELLRRHGVGAKTGQGLWDWLAAQHGGPATLGAQIGRLRTASPALVGEYALGDVLPLFALHDRLEPLLRARHAWEWYLVEEELLPVLLAMRRRGVRVDVAAAEQLTAEWGKTYERKLKLFGAEVYGSLWKKLSRAEQVEHLEAVAPGSSVKLAAAYAQRGVRVPLTAKTGAPSVTKAWLAAQGDPMSKLLRELRALSKLQGTFVDGYVLQHQIRGRVHPTLNQLFPRTLRMSSQDPNEQNIPERDEELAPLVRGLFLPEAGEEWVRCDDSQQEYRLLVHNAVGPGAREARARYAADPATDFHQLAADLLGVPRSTTVKNGNFALTYRAGDPRLAQTLGISLAEAKEFRARYNAALPFVTRTAEEAQRLAEAERDDGGYYVKLLLEGMRMYFDRWEITDWDAKSAARDEPDVAVRGVMDKALHTLCETEVAARELAAETFGDGRRWRVGRAGTYKALNTVIQPSGAQLMKRGMVLLQRAGIYDVLGVPLVSVHDELGFSVGPSAAHREALAEAHRLLEHRADAELRVPLYVGLERGPDWGHLE